MTRSDNLYRIVTLIVAISAGAAAWAEVAEIRNHYREDVLRRKRVATHAFASDMLHGEFMDNHVGGVTALWVEYSASGVQHEGMLTHSSYADLVASIEKAHAPSPDITGDAIAKLNAHVDSILNTFQAMAMEIDEDILEDDICYAYWSVDFPGWERWARAYIEQRRADRPDIWAAFESKAVEWRQRNAARGAS
ncbi:hypothetical protein CMK11_20765 [Candidatus Poribacteria bacterium]|nr:hypothetical protein [Candidatus Poribacteria bacterium]